MPVRRILWLLGLVAAQAGCAVHTPAPQRAELPIAGEEAGTPRTVQGTLTLTGFTETLANGYVVGVLVHNVGPHDRVVLTAASMFLEVRFVDALEETVDLMTVDDSSPRDVSCEPLDGVLLRPGEALRLSQTFVEADPMAAVIATFEVLVSEPSGALPVSPRRIHFRAELGEPMPPAAPSAAPAAPPRLAVTGQHVFLSADGLLMVGVRVRNDGNTPVLVPGFSLLHAATSVGVGEFFPLVGRSSAAACPLCASGPGPVLCDGAEGVLLAPGEAITLVAGQEESDSESTPVVAGARALVSYLFDGHSLICDVPAVRTEGEFSVSIESLH